MKRDYWTQLEAMDQEIAQLQSVNADLQRECTKRAMRIAELERLIARAADALEAWHEDQELTFDSLRREEQLVAQLRKAAQ